MKFGGLTSSVKPIEVEQRTTGEGETRQDLVARFDHPPTPGQREL